MSFSLSICSLVLVLLFTVCVRGEFLHSVASGTPQATSVIIWTRYTPPSAFLVTVPVFWRVSTVNDLSQRKFWVSHGTFETTVQRDFTVKVNVTGLLPGTQYFYGFSTDDAVSDVGMTRTAPQDGHSTSSSTFALYSCSNWRNGYFHAYSMGASADTLDFWVFVGDFIYELSNYEYPAKGEGARENLSPGREAVTLSDYRLRYAQYRTDPSLQAISRRAPMIALWDDHEFADNADIRGAENHQPVCYDREGRRPSDPGFVPFNCDQDEGDWQTRINAASQAYHEWLPIPDKGSFDNPQDRLDITTVTQWGDLMTIYGTDNRVTSRTCVDNCGGDWEVVKPLVANETDKAVYDNPTSPLTVQLNGAFQGVVNIQQNTSNKLISFAEQQNMQSAFMKSKQKGVPWQIFLSQDIFSPQQHPDYFNAIKLYPDQYSLANLILSIAFQINSLFRASYASLQRHIPISGDQWDGYAYQRNQMLGGFLQSTNNLVVLSGDSHNAWAFELTLDGVPVGVEFAGTSITSDGYESVSVPMWDFFGGVGFQMWRSAWLVSNAPGLKYTNPIDRGFAIMRVTPYEMVAEYYFMGSTVAPDYRSNSYPYGADGVSNSTWNGKYYCEGVKTIEGSKKLTTNVACKSTFGNGMDPLDGSSNVYGTGSAHVLTVSLISIAICVTSFLFVW